MLVASVDDLVGRVENALTDDARAKFSGMTAPPRYFSETLFRAWWQGVPRGEATALLRILVQRGLTVSEDQRRRIRECTDIDELDTWLDRVLLVASVEDLLS